MRRIVFLFALPLIGIAGFALPFALPEAKAAPELSRRSTPTPEATEPERAAVLGQQVAALLDPEVAARRR